MKIEVSCCLITSLVFAASVSYAQIAPKEAVAARVNAYRETGAAFKSINDQLKSGAPAKVMLRSSARVILATAHDQYSWFPAGSGSEGGVKTKALPVIWADPAGFRSAQQHFQQEAELMVKAVESGDLAAISAQAHDLGLACAACHNKYRAGD